MDRFAIRSSLIVVVIVVLIAALLLVVGMAWIDAFALAVALAIATASLAPSNAIRTNRDAGTPAIPRSPPPVVA